MKKKIALLCFLLLVAAGVIVWRKAKTDYIELPLIEPADEPATQLAKAFPDRTSRVVLTVRIPINKLSGLAEKAVPKSFQGEYDVPDMAGLSGLQVSPDLTREALGLRPVLNTTPPKIEVDTRLSGTVGVKGYKEVTVDLGLGKVRAKSPQLKQTFDVDASIRGGIALGLNPDWTFTHSQDIKVEVQQADTKLFEIVAVSLTKEVQKAADDRIPGFVDAALKLGIEQVPLRAAIEKAWVGMNQFIKIKSDPDTYMTITPQNVRLQEVRFKDANYLTVRLAVDGQIQTLVSNQTPIPPKTSDLPNLIQDTKIDPKFSVLLPIGIELSTINPQLAAAINETKLDLDEDSTLVVKDLTLYSKNDVVYAKLKFDATNAKLSAHVSGTLFLKCGVTVAENPLEIRLKDVDFCIETQNVLAKTAAWLGKKTICRKIEERVRIDLEGPLQKLRESVNQSFSNLDVGPNLKLKSSLNQVGFEDILIRNNFIIVGFDLSGEIRGEIVLE